MKTNNKGNSNASIQKIIENSLLRLAIAVERDVIAYICFRKNKKDKNYENR